MNPLVSIIIPVYNAQSYIRQTLLSCLGQSYFNLEIIIVNDGSKDNSESVILEFNDDRLKYYKIKNSGASNARNYGLSQATGTLIQFLDADDLLDTKKIELQVDQYRVHGDDFVYSGVMGSSVNNKEGLEENFDFYYRNLSPEQYFTEMFNHFGKYYTTGIWLTPRVLAEKTYGWDEKAGLNDDGEYFTRIICLSKGIVFCPSAIFYYRRDAVMSFSKQFDSKDVYIKWLYSYTAYVKTFHTSLPEKTAKKLGRKALSVYYCNSYPNYPDLRRECRKQIRQLGYRSASAHGGGVFKLLSSFLGVDNALRIRTIKDKKIKKTIPES